MRNGLKLFNLLIIMTQHYVGRKNKSGEVEYVNNIQCKFKGDPTMYTVLGGAASQILGSTDLANILRPSQKIVNHSIDSLETNSPIEPLSLHTSVGTSTQLSEFIAHLEPHLPLSLKSSWSVSLQQEGASAVHAAVDILIRDTLGDQRKFVGVGTSCYHGPKSSSFGSKIDGYLDIKQLFYPVPLAKYQRQNETVTDFHNRISRELDSYIESHKDKLSVILIEPQWGSSGLGQLWPKEMLKKFIRKAHLNGIKIVADEIMCGLGRHGQKTMFLSQAWDLDVDAITFGKAIGGSIYSLSGAIVKYEGKCPCPQQSHTYGHGANILGLVTATEILRVLPQYYNGITERESIIDRYIKQLDNHPHLQSFGQGLLWGLYIDYDNIGLSPTAIALQLKEAGVLVYNVPDGILITPIYNANTEHLESAMKSLVGVFTQL